MKYIIKALLVFISSILFFSCTKVSENGYKQGYQRAIGDFKFQAVVFPKGEGYAPAAVLKNKTAYLYNRAAEMSWAEGTRFTETYLRDWEKGCIACCKKKGFKVELTTDKAPILGLEN